MTTQRIGTDGGLITDCCCERDMAQGMRAASVTVNNGDPFGVWHVTYGKFSKAS